MSILPTWPIAAGALVIGLAGGAYVDHKIMQGRIDKITIEHAKVEQERMVQRTRDEVAARENERLLVEKINAIETERINEVAAIKSDADRLVDRLRKQAASKPTNPGGVPTTCTAGESAAGPAIPERTGVDLVALAQRADEVRTALGACYKAYDSLR